MGPSLTDEESSSRPLHTGNGERKGPKAFSSKIGLKKKIARGTVRLSVGWYTSEEQIDRAASLLIAAWEDLLQANPAASAPNGQPLGEIIADLRKNG